MKQRLQYPGFGYQHHQHHHLQQPFAFPSDHVVDGALRAKNPPPPQKPTGASNYSSSSSIPSRHPPHQLLSFHTPIRYPLGQRQPALAPPDRGGLPAGGKTLQTVPPLAAKQPERRPTQGPSSLPPPPFDPMTSQPISKEKFEVTSRTPHAKASVMEKYESLGMVGEGSYGMVLKCRHRESGQLVAIKKFIESEDDKMVKKIAMREIRMLKQLRHDNLVNLIEVFRRKKRLYLVFEFMDHTVLDDLDRSPGGLEEDKVRRILFQVLRGIEFCHLHNIIHRDIKPENILVSKSGVVKMCDFGFARTLAKPGEVYTDYVATRWYRAPELLVGDTNYGRAVDIWAIGCLFGELLTAEPLFPGESDIDQLFHIIKCFGYLTARHQEIFHKNPLFERLRLPVVSEVEPLEKRYARLSPVAVDFMTRCLQLDADDRPTCSQLLKHDFFTANQFAQKFNRELQGIIQKEHRNNPLLKKGRTPDRELAPKAGGGAQTNHGYGTDGEQNDKQENDKISLDPSSEKPKRKLPDVEKVSRTSPPMNSTSLSNGGTTSSPRASVTQHLQTQESSSSSIPISDSLSNAMTLSLQGIGNAQERMLEKSKAHSKKGGNHVAGKKGNNLTNHYRSMVTSQLTTTTTGGGNQFSTNERPVIATKLKPGPKGQMAPGDRRDGRFYLPNVRPNEAVSPVRAAFKTSSNSQMTCMPQIGNADSFTETSCKNSPTVDRLRTPAEQSVNAEQFFAPEQPTTPDQRATNLPFV